VYNAIDYPLTSNGINSLHVQATHQVYTLKNKTPIVSEQIFGKALSRYITFDPGFAGGLE
jgi:hypothetical protein